MLEKILRLFSAFLCFFDPRRWGIIAETYGRTKFNAPFSISYAQGAEDLLLLSVLKKHSGFYIDIGAHHPNRFSVTRLLYDRGWRGINVDANPDVEELFGRWRPRDQFVNFAIGTQDKYRFTRFHESAISTVNSKWRQQFLEEGNNILDEIEVPGMTMKDLFDLTPSNIELDLVNLDIEGGDEDALNSLFTNGNFPEKMPTWFLCESPAGVTSALESKPVKILTKIGYKPWAVLSMSTLLRKD